MCGIAGIYARPGHRASPELLLTMAGELRHVRYQFVAPYVLDSSAFQETFGVRPTPTDEALRATLGA